MPTVPGAGDATIVYNCPSCRHRHAVSEGLAGRKARCRHCGHVGKIVETRSAGLGGSEYELAGPLLPDPRPALAPASSPVRAEVSPDVSRRRRGLLAQAWAGGAAEESQIQGFAVLLIILSAADLLMTVTLLRLSPRFFEGNPVANWFLARWNVLGLVAFKFGILGGVTVVSELVERHRPGWGRFILLIGCTGAAYAVYTGLRLYFNHVEVPVH
jgi:hypothetical protein